MTSISTKKDDPCMLLDQFFSAQKFRVVWILPTIPDGGGLDILRRENLPRARPCDEPTHPAKRVAVLVRTSTDSDSRVRRSKCASSTPSATPWDEHGGGGERHG